MRPFHRLYRRWRLRGEIARLAGTRVLSALAAGNPEAYFVQVGANDGRMMDPLRRIVPASRWRGLAIEPVPQFYDRLCETYRVLGDRVRPINAAVAATSGTQSFYYLREREGSEALPPWAAGLGSFRRDVILQHADKISGIEGYLVEIEVPCLSWGDLCAKHADASPNLVLVDTEGYDFEIVRQIDFGQRQRPVVLIYEHHHFDPETDIACTALLKGHEYGLFREGLDSWAIDRRNEDPRYAQLLQRWPRWVESSRYATVL